MQARNLRTIPVTAAMMALFLGAVSTEPLAAQNKQKSSPSTDTSQDASAKPSQPAVDRAGLLRQLSSSLNELTSRVSPSVVQVLVSGYRVVEDKDDDETALLGRQRSLGSGVIVDPDGYIITNAHVVKGAQRVRVVLTAAATGDSQVRATLGEHLPPMDAKVVGTAPTFDLALLKISATNLPALAFADYWKLQKGQLVLAFGNPEGLENSVTLGVVSAVARQPDPENPFVFIQTDAPINPGNSGGALVDTDGQLVGINTFILSASGGSQGLGFAIPSSLVKYVYEQLRKQGHVRRSVIGVVLQDITPDLAEGLALKKQEGVIVSDVVPDGRADKAGLKIQDILLSLDGSPVGSVPLAEMVISTRPPGTTIKSEILRGTEKRILEIPVTPEKDDIERITDLIDPNTSVIPRLGIFGVEISGEIAEELGDDLRIPSGVIVAARAANTSGAETELQPGDVIHAMNGKHVEKLDAFRAAIETVPPNGPVVLQVERDAKFHYVTLELD
jgi:serine protease Do